MELRTPWNHTFQRHMHLCIQCFLAVHLSVWYQTTNDRELNRRKTHGSIYGESRVVYLNIVAIQLFQPINFHTHLTIRENMAASFQNGCNRISQGHQPTEKAHTDFKSDSWRYDERIVSDPFLKSMESICEFNSRTFDSYVLFNCWNKCNDHVIA